MTADVEGGGERHPPTHPQTRGNSRSELIEAGTYFTVVAVYSVKVPWYKIEYDDYDSLVVDDGKGLLIETSPLVLET